MRLFIVLLILAAGTSASAGEIYQWVDERGQVNYTDTPPAGRSYVAVTTAPAPAAAVIETEENAKASTLEAAGGGSRQGAERNTREAAVDPSAERASSCQAARRQLAYLDLRRVDKPDDDPLRSVSREREDAYQGRLAAYERFQAARQVQLDLIREYCED
jgi:Domain of unknown function (DUF4124)